MGEESNKPGGLEMGHDPEHEITEWHIQRIGWALMLLLCIAALAGVLGDGPAANMQQGKIGEELYLEYDRYVRHQAPFIVKVFCRPEQSNDFSLSFTRSFLEKHEVKEIQPEPESTEISSDRSTYRFKSTGAGEHLVTFRFESDGFGKVHNEVTLNGKITRKMKQFIWP